MRISDGSSDVCSSDLSDAKIGADGPRRCPGELRTADIDAVPVHPSGILGIDMRDVQAEVDVINRPQRQFGLEPLDTRRGSVDDRLDKHAVAHKTLVALDILVIL